MASALFQPGSWSGHSVGLAASAFPAAIGHQLGIELDNVTAGDSWIGIDNVRLSDAIPEPATVGLVLLGAAACLVARRRRSM